MKLLIITQKVDKNDPVLGFFHEWIFRFSQKVDKLFVIANEAGYYDLPKKVEVHSLGKERGYGKIRKYLRCRKLIKKLSKQSDGIFIHMCPEYAILTWLFSTNKKIVMWYVHKSKNFKLWLAEKMVDKIFTVSKNSCQVKSKKIEIVGHGIDVNKMQNTECRMQNDFFYILSVGRISEIKDYKTLVRAMCYLVHKKAVRDIRLTIVGDAYLKADLEYKKEVEDLIKKKKLENRIRIIKGISQEKLSKVYNLHDLLVNLCPTGGMDKVVLEAAACELPILAANKSFESLVGDYDLIFEYNKPEDLAEKILKIIGTRQCIVPKGEENRRREIGRHLRKQVVEHHNLSDLIQKITTTFQHS